MSTLTKEFLTITPDNCNSTLTVFAYKPGVLTVAIGNLTMLFGCSMNSIITATPIRLVNKRTDSLNSSDLGPLFTFPTFTVPITMPAFITLPSRKELTKAEKQS